MKSAGVEGKSFGEPHYDEMVRRAASQVADLNSRERWRPDVIAQRFSQYEVRSRNFPVSKNRGQYTPRQGFAVMHYQG